MALREEWAGFKAGRLWQDEINVREFIQMNYTPYEGDVRSCILFSCTKN